MDHAGRAVRIYNAILDEVGPESVSGILLDALMEAVYEDRLEREATVIIPLRPRDLADDDGLPWRLKRYLALDAQEVRLPTTVS